MEQWMYAQLSKYHNKKTKVGNTEFDSKKEAKRWLELQMLQKAGQIQNLQRQVKFSLIPTRYYGKECVRGCSYVADFVYTENGKRIAEDIKGFQTDKYILKKKMFLEKYVLTGEFVFVESGRKYKVYERK